MKKLLSALLAAAMLCTSAIAFSGCGEDSSSSSSSSSDSDSAKITTADDLIGKSIGVQLGTTGDIYATDEYEKQGSKIERYNKGADAIVALTSGKIDAVIIDNEPAKAFVEANDGLKILDEPFAKEDYAICVAKDNEKLLNDINKTLAELKQDGTLDSIMKNYIGDDTKGKSPYKTPDGTEYPNGELHMATNAFFEPYEYYDGDQIVGIDAMTAQAICDKLGYKLVIDDMDFDAIVTAVQTGKADFGMAGMTVTDERLQTINFTDSYTTATQVIIVNK
ncbi:MAG: transporter substrate-binding domain-containing protein [Ruminococcus bromii]|nr:transporter substrate-binding domain-containing protein [Ruminococcus bromii]MCI7210862.1 transporter substrate-binding domain-containing protein [Ruminococcus bromii]MDD6433125.1 transporter substrate-binding domain-containing protein [Ruminococcus bromii]MDY4084915.1 transporter substrate-binding domain-containing protein [Ruminococcus bromii]MDY4711358.1 transporter substrate-binding domain-containing protein [Ruminococcus bromii]